MRCSNCGSNRIAVNPITGELVCQMCGVVLDENPIDDSPTTIGKPPWGEPMNVKRILKEKKYRSTIAGLETSNWGRSPRRWNEGPQPVDHVATGLLPLIRKGLPPHRVFKKRTLSAIAVYVWERSEGATKRMALQVASNATGVSVKTLEKIIREYRDWVDEVVRRVAME